MVTLARFSEKFNRFSTAAPARRGTCAHHGCTNPLPGRRIDQRFCGSICQQAAGRKRRADDAARQLQRDLDEDAQFYRARYREPGAKALNGLYLQLLAMGYQVPPPMTSAA